MKTFITLALSMLAAGPAQAAVEAQSAVRSYDDTETQVLSPSIDVSGTFNNDTMKVDAGWAQDHLTSASSDVVTFSSKGTIDDVRTEYSGSFESQIPDGTMSVGYIQSDEDDYHSKIISAGGTREFFQKNTVVSLSFANGKDRINSTSNPTFDERMDHQIYSLSLSQVISRNSLIQFIYDLRIESGFIASPYRRAKFVNPDTGLIYLRDENHPRTRNRNAWAVKYNYHYQPWDISLATTYRFYQDSWGVLSHTIEERVTKEINRQWSGSLLLRVYRQDQAKFFSDYYSDPNTPFYTGNTTLGALSGYMVGVRPAYTINDNFSLYGKLEYYFQDFKNASAAGKYQDPNDDKPLETRARVIGLGLSAKF